MLKDCRYKINLASFALSFEAFAVKNLTSNNKLKLIFLIITKLIFSFSFSNDVFSQSVNLTDIISHVIEEIASDASDPEEAALYTEKLHDLADDPVDVNSSDPDEISRLFFLSDFQVKSLMDYTRNTGRILTVYEIAAIPGFDRELASMMIPFINIDDISIIASSGGRWRNSFITSLSYRTGAMDSTYPGSPWKSLTKYKFAAGSLSGGFTMEKDAGEKFFINNTLIPDFFSANICYTGKGIIRKIIAGDFSSRSGQGTNLNTGIRTGLSLVSPGFMAAKNELKPYTSTDENNFFRGTAMAVRIRNVSASFFFSLNSHDAATDSTGGLQEDHIISLDNTGLHNTQSSLQKMDAVSIKTWGLNISYDYRNIRLGLSGVSDRLSLRMDGSGNSLRDLYDFKGYHNSVYSAFYNSTIRNLLLFGEISLNENGKHAIVQGLSAKPAGRLTLNLLYRNYSPGYTSFHGKGPGVSSETANEEGMLGNFTFEAAKHLFITGGCDISKFRWLRYRCSAPSYAIKKVLFARYAPSDKMTMEALYNYRYAMVDRQGTGGIKMQTQVISRSIRGTIKYSPSDNISFTTRVDHTMISHSSDRGILMLQDLKFFMKKISLTVWMRYCIFNTDSYNSRIYTYENDLLYSFSIPALSGSGSRSYIMIKWDAGKKAEMRLKYGITSTGTAFNNTGHREDIKIQVRLRF